MQLQHLVCMRRKNDIVPKTFHPQDMTMAFTSTAHAPTVSLKALAMKALTPFIENDGLRHATYISAGLFVAIAVIKLAVA